MTCRRPPTPRPSATGFTLVEVVLAIVVGIGILAGAVTIYNQTKTSTANSLAKEKEMALSNVVEESGAANGGAFPSLATLQALWPTKRPQDYNTSPWGGTLTGVGLDGNPLVPVRTLYGDGESGGAATASTFPSDRGRLYYMLTVGTAIFWVDDFSVGDGASGTTRVNSYAIAYLNPDNGQHYYFVIGPGATRAAGTGPGGALSGGIGN